MDALHQRIGSGSTSVPVWMPLAGPLSEYPIYCIKSSISSSFCCSTTPATLPTIVRGTNLCYQYLISPTCCCLANCRSAMNVAIVIEKTTTTRSSLHHHPYVSYTRTLLYYSNLNSTKQSQQNSLDISVTPMITPLPFR